MSPELKTILDQWSSYPSKFIRRSINIFSDNNGNDRLDFECEYIGDPTYKEFCRIDIIALDGDISTCTKTLYKFWENFCGNLIPHLETNWISIENEAPIPHRNLDLAIITPLVVPITKEFSSEVHFSEGFFNGAYFQINDPKAASDVNTSTAFVRYWKYV